MKWTCECGRLNNMTDWVCQSCLRRRKEEPPRGWECPRCHAVNAPWVIKCQNCKPRAGEIKVEKWEC